MQHVSVTASSSTLDSNHYECFIEFDRWLSLNVLIYVVEGVRYSVTWQRQEPLYCSIR